MLESSIQCLIMKGKMTAYRIYRVDNLKLMMGGIIVVNFIIEMNGKA